jgi:hypothetical protein
MMVSFGMFFLILCFVLNGKITTSFHCLRTKAEFLYGALHLSDSTSHNVAIRFLSVRPKSMRRGFCGTFRSITVIEVGDNGEHWH